MKAIIDDNRTEFNLLMQFAYAALSDIERLEQADEKISDELKKPIELGEFLHKIGGVEVMRFVLQHHFKPYDHRLVEMYWDRIGAWLA